MSLTCGSTSPRQSVAREVAGQSKVVCVRGRTRTNCLRECDGWRARARRRASRCGAAKANRLPGMNRLHLNGYGSAARPGRHDGEERGSGPGCPGPGVSGRSYPALGAAPRGAGCRGQLAGYGGALKSGLGWAGNRVCRRPRGKLVAGKTVMAPARAPRVGACVFRRNHVWSRHRQLADRLDHHRGDRGHASMAGLPASASTDADQGTAPWLSV